MKLKSADGVVVDIPVSHLKQHSDVLEHLGLVISGITTGNQSVIKEEIDMGRVIGTTDCVKTDRFDDIVYAQREGRPWTTRFVLDREPEPCSHITVVMKRNGDQYKLLTAYIGRMAEKEPDDLSIRDNHEYMRAKHYWDSHALVWGRQEVVS
jgi:hypothetical protein